MQNFGKPKGGFSKHLTTCDCGATVQGIGVKWTKDKKCRPNMVHIYSDFHEHLSVF